MIALMAIVEVDGGTLALSAAQLLLVGPIPDSLDWHCFS